MFGNSTRYRSLLCYERDVTDQFNLRVKSGGVILFWMPWVLTEMLKFVQQINPPSFCCVLIKQLVEEPLLLVLNILAVRAS
jgi:hypothetical protein